MATPPEPVPSPMRLRLVFDNRRLLRRAQRDDGLRRCWLLLRPELVTVADLSAHIAARFRLHRSCPHGVVLSMDGFALPPFESTCIFRDKDMIRVKQKACRNTVQHHDVHFIQDTEIVGKQPLPIDDKILAVEYQVDHSKHQEEELQCDHQHEEYAIANRSLADEDTCSKRKLRDGDAGIAESSKRKKQKVKNHRKQRSMDIGCIHEGSRVHKDQDQCGSKESKLSSIDTEAKKAVIQAKATVTLEEEQKTDRSNQTDLNCEAEVADHNAQGGAEKGLSRSARRKKSKRQFRLKQKELKENVNCQESPTVAAADGPSSSNKDSLPCPSSNQNDLHLPFSSHEAEEEESDTSDDIVPVVVRPGHIRFEPAGGEPNTSSPKEIQEIFQWSGPTSKKKGQKWGMNNSNKKGADVSYDKRTIGSDTEVNHIKLDTTTAENGFYRVSSQKVGASSHDGSVSEKTVAEEGKSSSEPLDFESLYPLTRFPKEGDLIAYRLVVLTSSWCPELTSYRVGEVLIYDHISSRIILLPVPEYPIIPEEKEDEDESGMRGEDESDMHCEDESDVPVDISPYKEDGSLEIEYSSLLDVRLVKGNESVPSAISAPIEETGKKGGSLVGKPVTSDQNEGKICNQTGSLVPNNTKDPKAAPEKTQNKIWQENGEGEAPKDEPAIKGNGWGPWTRNASTSAWSYRVQRSSALGPTLAFLRAGDKSKGGKPS